jgi:hypothetical protein
MKRRTRRRRRRTPQVTPPVAEVKEQLMLAVSRRKGKERWRSEEKRTSTTYQPTYLITYLPTRFSNMGGCEEANLGVGR